MIEVVAAGVIDGKIETDASCMAPASASCRRTGSRPVFTAGQTTCGVAVSMTTRRTFTVATTRLAETQVIDHRRDAGSLARQLQHAIALRPGIDDTRQRDRGAGGVDVDIERLHGIVEGHLGLDLRGDLPIGERALRLVRR